MTDAPTPEQLAVLERAMKRLPRFPRTLLLMAAVDRRSYTDIAKTLGITERQVERHIGRALCRYSRFVDEEENPQLRRPRRRWLFFLSPRR